MPDFPGGNSEAPAGAIEAVSQHCRQGSLARHAGAEAGIVVPASASLP
jgi:hypothetical protein